MVLLFKMAPKHAAQVLSVPECKETVICLTEKLHVLDKLLSGMSYSAATNNFIVNEYVYYIRYL